MELVISFISRATRQKSVSWHIFTNIDHTCTLSFHENTLFRSLKQSTQCDDKQSAAGEHTFVLRLLFLAKFSRLYELHFSPRIPISIRVWTSDFDLNHGSGVFRKVLPQNTFEAGNHTGSVSRTCGKRCLIHGLRLCRCLEQLSEVDLQENKEGIYPHLYLFSRQEVQKNKSGYWARALSSYKLILEFHGMLR